MVIVEDSKKSIEESLRLFRETPAQETQSYQKNKNWFSFVLRLMFPSLYISFSFAQILKVYSNLVGTSIFNPN